LYNNFRWENYSFHFVAILHLIIKNAGSVT
jgi:hypothetical protein